MAMSRQKEARSWDYVLLLFRMTSRVLYSAQYHRQHCTLLSFEQFSALYMHNHDDKYPARPGFKPDFPRLQAPVDTNEPSGPAQRRINNTCRHRYPWVIQRILTCCQYPQQSGNTIEEYNRGILRKRVFVAWCVHE